MYNFQSPFTTIYQLWYIREASVAVQVANIICCWQLLQKVFKLRSFDNSTPNIGQHLSMVQRPPHNPESFTEGDKYMSKSWWDHKFEREGGMWSNLLPRASRPPQSRNAKDFVVTTDENSTVEDVNAGQGRTHTQRGNEIPIDPLRSNATRFSAGEAGLPAVQYRSINDIV